ncbi:EAL domain-containing protein [Rhodoferax sp. GW822-FHT02A01]|uniref:putative bifunctional diguanylate cyclase/phosphodiesterase n=1 Tax=Rhodoferax sp. GW822-FHT02A01 TaxID=3141537 RepID=UPI00315CA016
MTVTLVLTVIIGIVLPTVIAVVTLLWFRQSKVEQEMVDILQEKSLVLSASLAEPVWNFNMETISLLLRASMADSQVVRVSVFDTHDKILTEVKDDSRRMGRSYAKVQNLNHISGAASRANFAGKVEVEIDSGNRQSEFRHEVQFYSMILALQIASSMALLLYVLRARVLKPVAGLTQFSDQLAQGNFYKPLAWSRPDELGTLARQMDNMRMVMVDDIAKRKEADETIHNLAFYDPLTQLPNRRLLRERLKMAAVASERSGQYFALLFLDLDNFKTLNDTLGHSVGDELLIQVGISLIESVRADDTVARLGGDEFVVILQRVGSEPDAAAQLTRQIAEKICKTISKPSLLASQMHVISTSIGVTLHCGARMDIDVYLKEADLAMYQAKAAGRNCVCFFDEQMHTTLLQSANLEASLRDAIRGEEFLLLYQPQVMQTGHIMGAECLVRWMHSDRGLVSPNEFIPIAEKTGLILPLGQWILEQACTKLAIWSRHELLSQLSISVNISACQLHQPDFVDVVLSTVTRSGANPRRLKLELTESQLIDNTEDIIEKMQLLKEKGIGFSLDDFGTGYSSLSYLRRFPLEQLKIDQSFVRDVLVDTNDAVITKMVIALAESLGLAVIAEGVEHEAQREYLARHGCNAYQGYLFGRPMPDTEFEHMVLVDNAVTSNL